MKIRVMACGALAASIAATAMAADSTPRGTAARSSSASGTAPKPALYTNLSIEDFARTAADKKAVILDVRTPAEFSAGHLRRALNLDVNAANFESEARKLPKANTYLVHCASGARSVKACEKLGGIGFTNLYNLPGGYRAWTQAGKPVEK